MVEQDTENALRNLVAFDELWHDFSVYLTNFSSIDDYLIGSLGTLIGQLAVDFIPFWAILDLAETNCS